MCEETVLVSLSPYTETSVGAVCPAPSFLRGCPLPLCAAQVGLSLPGVGGPGPEREAMTVLSWG